MVRTCSNCGSAEIDEDAARGDATCTACGTVLEESIVVTENQFQERAGGSGHTLVGQFVSAERAAANNFNGMGSQESREMTYAKGRKVIDELGSQLRINAHCMNTAFNFFKMCVSRNLTRGRNRSSVVAVCLYITCRLENTAHLLLDFSDVTQINVFDLGRNLNFISRSLRINLPATDPCLYIMRFACVLDFGDKQKEVVNLATRLVQRMKRDWMSTGRRPTGICGAALLIAARSLNFNRSINDIVRVVHISESVIRKRLDEFSQTPSGSLTIDEFSTVDLEHSEDPPAYREARRKAREDQLRKEAEQAESMRDQLGEMEAHVEAALDKKRKEKFCKSPYAKLISEGLDSENSGLEKAAEEMVRNEVLSAVFDAANEEPCSSNSLEKYEKFRPSLESLGIRRSDDTPINQPSTDNNACADDFDIEISDSEIDSYILSESEVAIKTDYWMKANGDAMQALEERRKEREENGEVKRKRKNPRKNDTPCTSAAVAVEKVIAEKKLSNKVNYEMLKDLETMGTKQHQKEESHLSFSQISLKVNSIDVTPASLTKNERIARGKNILRSVSGTSNMDKIRSALSLKEELTEKSSTVQPLVLKKEPLPTASESSNVSIIGEKSTPLARSRYTKVKPIIGSKKLASLADVKHTPNLPESSSHEASVSETKNSVSTIEPVKMKTEIPEAQPCNPAPPTEDVKPVVKSRYVKAKPNLKLTKPKVAKIENETEEPSSKRPKP